MRCRLLTRSSRWLRNHRLCAHCASRPRFLFFGRFRREHRKQQNRSLLVSLRDFFRGPLSAAILVRLDPCPCCNNVDTDRAFCVRVSFFAPNLFCLLLYLSRVCVRSSVLRPLQQTNRSHLRSCSSASRSYSTSRSIADRLLSPSLVMQVICVCIPIIYYYYNICLVQPWGAIRKAEVTINFLRRRRRRRRIFKS